MPGIDFRKVEAAISMAEVLRLIGWTPLRAEPTALRGRCPLHFSHSQRSRSFAVNEKGFRCFSCGARGSKIRLYAEVTRQNVFDAAKELCVRMNVRIPWLGPSEHRAISTRGTEKRIDNVFSDNGESLWNKQQGSSEQGSC